MSELQVIDVDLMPAFPRSLAAIFSDYIAANFANPEDPEDIRAEHVHFRVHANAFPYYQIIDFLERLESVREAAKIARIDLVYELPKPLWATETLHHELKRVLKALEDPHVWTDQHGSILSKECVVGLIKQLHVSNCVRASSVSSSTDTPMIEEQALAVLHGNCAIKREGVEPYHGKGVPDVTNGRVELDGCFDTQELLALLFFLNKVK